MLLYYIISYHINYIAKAASGAGVVSPSNIVASGTQERYYGCGGHMRHGNSWLLPAKYWVLKLKCAKCVFVALQIL